ncbi:MAG TPA: hypothetical protein V6D29_04005 [Leptolyngbyaceae cyanobacterium]
MIEEEDSLPFDSSIELDEEEIDFPNFEYDEPIPAGKTPLFEIGDRVEFMCQLNKISDEGSEIIQLSEMGEIFQPSPHIAFGKEYASGVILGIDIVPRVNFYAPQGCRWDTTQDFQSEDYEWEYVYIVEVYDYDDPLKSPVKLQLREELLHLETHRTRASLSPARQAGLMFPNWENSLKVFDATGPAPSWAILHLAELELSAIALAAKVDERALELLSRFAHGGNSLLLPRTVSTVSDDDDLIYIPDSQGNYIPDPGDDIDDFFE